MKFILLVLLTSILGRANVLCLSSFNADSKVLTQKFIALIEESHKENLLDLEDLKDILVHLEKKTPFNPFELKEINNETRLYGEVYQEYLDEAQLIEEEIGHYLKKKISASEELKRTQKKISQEVKQKALKIEFAAVKRGWKVRSKIAKVPLFTSVPYSFEVMAAPVTNSQFEEIFGISSGSSESISNGLIEHADLPFVGGNLISAMLFANKLSEKHNLPPTYVFINMKWKVSPQENIYHPIPESGEIRINTTGKYTKTLGYRLPTAFEMRFLQDKTKLQMKQSGASVTDFGWFAPNSQLQLNPVGLKAGVKLDDGEVFDIWGNSREILWGFPENGEAQFWGPETRYRWFFKAKQRTQLIFPFDEERGFIYTSSNNSSSPVFKSEISAEYLTWSLARYNKHSFRLVRTLK